MPHPLVVPRILIPAGLDTRRFPSVSVTPSGGAGLLTDGGFEIWDSPIDLTNWSEGFTGTSSVNREAAIIHGGTYALRLDVDALGSSAYIGQGNAIVGAWYLLSCWMRSSAGTPTLSMGVSPVFISNAIDTTYRQYAGAIRAVNTNGFVVTRGAGAAGLSLYADDYSASQAILSSLLGPLQTVTPQGTFEAQITGLQSGYPAGLWCQHNGASDGTERYIEALVDRASNTARLSKDGDAGLSNNLTSGAITYADNCRIKLDITGTTVTMYYAQEGTYTQVGTPQTITDLSLVSQVGFRVFCTDPQASVVLTFTPH